MDGEQIAQQAAERVREVIGEAERHAGEIVRAAEEEAAQVKARAEGEAREARERLERARQALADLATEAPGPDPAPEPETPTPRPEPAPPPEPETPGAPEAPTGPAAAPQGGDGDDAAARLVAMKLAVDGRSREEIAAELERRFGDADRSALLDDVLARAGK